MEYEPTEKEYKEAMEEMECWQTQSHLKKCEKCRKWAEDTQNELKVNDYLYEKHSNQYEANKTI